MVGTTLVQVGSLSFTYYCMVNIHLFVSAALHKELAASLMLAQAEKCLKLALQNAILKMATTVSRTLKHARATHKGKTLLVRLWKKGRRFRCQ